MHETATIRWDFIVAPRGRIYVAAIFALLVLSLSLGMIPIQAPNAKPAITALAVLPDGSGVVLGSQAGVFERTWDGREKRALATELDNVHQLAFSPAGKVLAVAGGTPAEFGVVELWSWPDKKLIRSFEGHDDLVYDCAWLSGGKLLATASADRSVRVWDAETGDEKARLTGHSGPVLALAVSPDGKLLCTGSADQTIRVWDTSNWQLVRSMTNHLGPVHALTFRAPATMGDQPRSSTTAHVAEFARIRAVGAPNSGEFGDTVSYLASAGGDSTVRIWQPEIGRLVRIVRHPAAVLTLAWDSAGSLYSGSKDGHVRTIDADTGEVGSDRPLSAGWITSVIVRPSERQMWAGDSLGKISQARD